MHDSTIKHIIADYNIIEITTRILVAYFMGIFIGMERAHHKKPIGSRTTSIVCMGAALLSCYEEVFAKSIILQNFNLVNLKSELLYRIPDYNRITAQIVSGIGFLGAGMIIQNRGKLYGITTAAIVWTTACLGIVIGSGQWVLSAIGGICIFCSTYIYKLPYIITNKKILTEDEIKTKYSVTNDEIITAINNDINQRNIDENLNYSTNVLDYHIYIDSEGILSVYYKQYDDNIYYSVPLDVYV